jgi:hypothetical protein
MQAIQLIQSKLIFFMAQDLQKVIISKNQNDLVA